MMLGIIYLINLFIQNNKAQSTHSNTREGNTYFICSCLQTCFMKISLHSSEQTQIRNGTEKNKALHLFCFSMHAYVSL